MFFFTPPDNWNQNLFPPMTVEDLILPLDYFLELPDFQINFHLPSGLESEKNVYVGSSL